MNVNDFKPFVPGDKVTLRLSLVAEDAERARAELIPQFPSAAPGPMVRRRDAPGRAGIVERNEDRALLRQLRVRRLRDEFTLDDRPSTSLPGVYIGASPPREALRSTS